MSQTVRRVEFVGLPSPYAHPDVLRVLGAPVRSVGERQERRLMRKELTRQERKRQMQGFARVPGRTQLTIGPEHGLAGTYVWGPATFVVEMPLDDVERLFRLHPAHALAFKVHQDLIVVRT